MAIVGSGPSAFYAARTIAKRDSSVQIDIIEKLPVPFGRYLLLCTVDTATSLDDRS